MYNILYTYYGVFIHRHFLTNTFSKVVVRLLFIAYWYLAFIIYGFFALWDFIFELFTVLPLPIHSPVLLVINIKKPYIKILFSVVTYKLICKNLIIHD